ncbi:hypothetical protein CW304_26180 [Bacillus sp. UFRGS-B20]|nr:hypothetical protein CW304_26180 [Bacillus sp. UFRGS-B20]
MQRYIKDVLFTSRQRKSFWPKICAVSIMTSRPSFQPVVPYISLCAQLFDLVFPILQLSHTGSLTIPTSYLVYLYHNVHLVDLIFEPIYIFLLSNDLSPSCYFKFSDAAGGFILLFSAFLQFARSLFSVFSPCMELHAYDNHRYLKR